MVGPLIGSAILQKVQTNVCWDCRLVACVLVVGSMLTFGHVAMWTIIFL